MMNPPKFDLVEDMAELLYMHEPAVVHSLKQRYKQNDIYASRVKVMLCSDELTAPQSNIDILWPFLGSSQSIS
jgi:hypothetical protein